MKRSIKSAFDSVHAEPALKQHTRDFLAQKMQPKKRAAFPVARRLTAALACMALLFGCGYYIFLTPVAAISVDINPSLELAVNRFDKVVAVRGYNEDGRALAAHLSLFYDSYQDALDEIMANTQVQQLLAQDDLVSITVACDDEMKNEAMLADVHACAALEGEQAECGSASREVAAAARASGLSLGKYRAFLALQALDPAITADDVSGLTMRQIRDWIESLGGTYGVEAHDDAEHTELGDTEDAVQGHHADGNGTGNGNGAGTGNGAGNGNGNGTGMGNGAGNGNGAGMGNGNGTCSDSETEAHS